MPDQSRKKQAGTKWKPGTSGNPAGRPKGSGLAGELRKAIAANAGEIIAALIVKAREGDVQAGRLLLDRIVPALKSETLPVRLPGVTAGTLTERAYAALTAAGNGELSPDAANALLAAVGGLARIVETDELERRIAALEEKA